MRWHQEGARVTFVRRVFQALGGIPPLGLKAGHRSKIYRPRLIEGAAWIRIGERSVVRENSWLSVVGPNEGRPRLVIGDGVYIGRHACITAFEMVEIGDGSVLSEHVYIADSSHGLDPLGGPIMRQPLESKGPVRIGKNVFLGYGCRVLSGVTLGDHCVVGTNAVVNRSFPAYTMLAGAPAKPVKRYDVEARQWRSLDAGE